MTCFNHAEIVEVGGCAVCNKHLCKDCYTVIRDRVICKSDVCKTTLDKADYLIERSLKIYGYGRKRVIPYLGTIVTLLGVYFLWAALTTEEPNIVSLVASSVLFVVGLIALYRSLKYRLDLW